MGAFLFVLYILTIILTITALDRLISWITTGIKSLIKTGINDELTHTADADLIHGKATDGLPHKSPLSICSIEDKQLHLQRRYIDNILKHPLNKYSKEELENLINDYWPRTNANEELKRIQNALSKKLRKLNRRTKPIREKKESHVTLKSVFLCDFCGLINHNPEDFYCKGCGKYNYGKDKSLLESKAVSGEEISCINCNYTQPISATELCSNCGLNIYEKVEYQTCTNCGSEFQTELVNCPIC